MDEKCKDNKKIKIKVLLPAKAIKKSMQDYIPLDASHPNYDPFLDGGFVENYNMATIVIREGIVEIPFSILRLKEEEFLFKIDCIKNKLLTTGIDIDNFYKYDFLSEKNRREFVEKKEIKRRRLTNRR